MSQDASSDARLVHSGASVRLDLARMAVGRPNLDRQLQDLLREIDASPIQSGLQRCVQHWQACRQGDGAQDAERIAENPALWPWLPWLAGRIETPPRLRETASETHLQRFVSPVMAGVMLSSAATLTVLGFILVWVVPNFDALFQEFELDLPFVTKAVIELSRFLSNYWFPMAIILAGIALMILWRSRRGRRVRADEARRAASQWADSLADWVDCGAGRPAAARMAIEAIELPHLRRTLKVGLSWGSDPDGRSGSGRGEAAAGAIALPGRVLPPSLAQAIRTEPSSERLVGRLRTLAEIYRSRSAMNDSAVGDLLPVLQVVFVAALVGSMVIALLLPMISMLTGLTGS